MKCAWRVLLVVGMSVCGGPVIRLSGEEPGAAPPSLRRSVPPASSTALPRHRLEPTPASSPASFSPDRRASADDTKLRFTPVRIRGSERIPRAAAKVLPSISRTLDQKHELPERPLSWPRFGVRVELEAGYGDHDTLIGVLRHGAQFEGGHYALTGHWERTRHAAPDQREEHVSARLIGNFDLSDASKIVLNGGYTHSRVALPQLPGAAAHIKSAVQARAGYQANLTATLSTGVAASWEDAGFRDEHAVESTFRKYGGHVTLRSNWNATQTLSLDVNAGWEQLAQAADPAFGTIRYYGSAVALNSFVMSDRFSLDVGVQSDYYHSAQAPHTNYHVAPIITTRWQPFRSASWYAQYRPRLNMPDFTDLYIRKLYTTVNPELRSETQRHYLEVGFQQRLDEAFVVNVGGFYHDSRDFIVQIDANADHILEYEHMASVDFLGVRANLQMNYRERLAQNITYTYTTHSIFSEQQVSPSADDLRNRILPYRPNHQVQAGLTWNLPFGLSMKVNGLYVSEQYRNRSEDQPPIGRRFFVNVEATQRISSKISVFVAGRNLTDISTYDIIPWLNSEEITSSRLIIGGMRMRL